MAFIVEMFWGKASHITVYDLDEEGELYPARLIPTGENDPERRTFSCHGNIWKDCLFLAREYGWEALGTVAPEHSKERWERAGGIQNDYQPHEIPKEVTGKDAANLADALERLAADQERLTAAAGRRRPYLIREGMTDAELVAANRGLDEGFLRDFASFLRKGPFGFAWDD